MRIRSTMRMMSSFGVLLLLALFIAACGASEKDAGAEAPIVVEREKVESERVVDEGIAVEAQEDMAGEVAEAPGDGVGQAPSAAGPVTDFQPQTTQRLIIKDAALDLEVDDTDRTIDSVTQVAGDMQGYIISQRVWYDDEAKFATITLAVPVQAFENALRRLRGLATRVMNESASGEDVTDQYVDLQSRLRNLEATRDRVRSFLDQATSVEEALEVNRQLSDIEDEIEQVQGRINYLRDRAAFSTITVNLNPILPTPTPTLTPTPTPTPTPEAWRPGETAQEATGVLVRIVQGLVELLIWLVIVLGPFIVVCYVLLQGALWLGKRYKRGRQRQAPRAAPAKTEEGQE